MPATTAKRQYRLLSTSLINTAGILRWAQNGYKFKRDRKNLLRVFTEGYGGHPNSPTKEEFHRLLMGEIPWTEEPGEEGPSVLFEI